MNPEGHTPSLAVKQQRVLGNLSPAQHKELTSISLAEPSVAEGGEIFLWAIPWRSAAHQSDRTSLGGPMRLPSGNTAPYNSV